MINIHKEFASPIFNLHLKQQTIKTHFYFTIKVWSLLTQVHEDGYFLMYLIYQPPDKKTAWADMINICKELGLPPGFGLHKKASPFVKELA